MSSLKPALPAGGDRRKIATMSAAGRIQAHGIVTSVDAAALSIECITENVESLLGIPAMALCGEPIATLLEPAGAAEFITALRDPRLAVLNPHELTLTSARSGGLAVEGTVHRCRDRYLIELEPADAGVEMPPFGEARAPIERLAAAADLPHLLAGAAHDVRRISGFDQTCIYRFDGDSRVEVVAAVPDSPPDADRRLKVRFGESRRLQLRQPLRLISDTRSRPVRLVAKNVSALPEPDDLARASLYGASAAELDPFEGSGGGARLTISIVVGGQVWGLIVCRHATPRRLGYRKRAVCELLGHILEWQLDSRIKAARVRERARTAALQARIGAALEATADVGRAVLEAAPLLFELCGADGLAVRIDNELRCAGSAPRDGTVLDATAALLNGRSTNGVATQGQPLPAIFIRLSHDGTNYVLLFGDGAGDAGRCTRNTRDMALNLRGRLGTRLQMRDCEQGELSVDTDRYLAGRTSQAAALIKLHEDVAAALPSRAAIIDVILDFVRQQTNADGSVVETLTETEIVGEAASGILAHFAGTRRPRSGSASGMSAEINAPLLCNDIAADSEGSERDEYVRLSIASTAVVPVEISSSETIVLKVASTKRDAFGNDDVQTLKLAATNLRTAVRAAREFAAFAAAEQEQRDYARRLRALHAIASTTRSNRKDQIDAALRLGLEQLDLDWAFLGVIDYATQEFVIENSVSRDGTFIVAAGVREPLGATLVGRVAQNKGVRIMQDVSQSVERPAYGGWASFIAAPLFIAGVNYGTIGFTSRDARPQPFSEANIEFIAVAGELISSAVERGLQREQLETSETRYRALTEAIPEMVWVVDADARFEYVNARWTNYTGLNLEASRARGREGIFDDDGLAAMVARRENRPPAEFDCEVRLRRHDGVYRWHVVRSVPFRDSAGAPGKWLVTASDIEERKSAEALMVNVHDAALAATEAKSRFLATMSHEIRTPMNAVIGMTELLLLTQLSNEQREYIEIVRDSGQSLLRVLNDILDYSKIEAGKLELESVHFNLAGQIESVVELLRAQYQIKGVQLTTSIGSEIPAVVAGDPGRLRQILLNLAGNALKFTAAGGSVHIDVGSTPAYGDAATIRFTVEDTGIGIPPETVARLFQPFSQGDESTTRKYGGTGLGLSICAQIVALMSGKIGVRSVPGAGSAFWFEIPLRGAKNSAKPHDSRKRGAARAKPVVMRAEKILLVEDNEINTFLALKQLQRIGFIVSAVHNGRQAVDAVARERFDLVFMDCHMPEMDGFEATREIRRLEAGGTRHLPIVAMTADARTEDHQNCLRAGMDDYVSKPTSLESLRLVLDRWLPSRDRRQNSRTNLNRTGPAATLRVAKLLELFDGDRAAVITLLNAAAGSIKADFARIEHCVTEREWNSVAEAAHRLKGTSASIRSARLGDVSAAVERASLNGKVGAPLMAELHDAVDHLIADVERHSKVLATID